MPFDTRAVMKKIIIHVGADQYQLPATEFSIRAKYERRVNRV